MAIQMVFHLSLCFGHEAKTHAIAETTRDKSNSQRAGIPERIEQARPGIERFEATRGPREVIFFLTDADLMTNGDVNEILAEAGKTRIQAVEFGRGINLGERTPLRRLAATTGGAYLYIDVSQFPRSAAGY